MSWMEDFPARDLYDLIVAKFLDQEALDSAMQTIDVDERRRIARMIERDIETNSLDQRRIERPTYRSIEKKGLVIRR